MLNLSWTRVTLTVVRRRIGYTLLAFAAVCTSYPPAMASADDPEVVQEDAPERAIGAWDFFRAWYWYRLHRRWHRLWRDAQGGEPTQPDVKEDNVNTPGDDRPGYVLCASADDPSLTCSPEQRCCRSPENVCDSLQQDCQRPDVTVGWGDNCDGPEDCEQGLTCVRAKYGASCTAANPQQAYPVMCHADRDCMFLPEARCGADGVCAKL